MTRLLKQVWLLGVAAALASAFPTTTTAQSVTAFKTGENTTGQTKQCFYAFGGKSYTQTVGLAQICPLSIQVPTSIPLPSPAPTPAPTQITAFKTGEQTTGQTKQCYYSGLGKAYTKTVEAYQLCPMSIVVPSGS